MNISVCDKFKPTILNGEVCFSLQAEPMIKAEGGLKGGIVLFLDYNTERSTEVRNIEQEDTAAFSYTESDDMTSAQIYIPTLSPYTGYGSGSYIMTSLKQMTGTPAFLNLPPMSQNKQCDTVKYEECMLDLLLKTGKRYLGCVPFGWTSAINHQVEKIYYDCKTLFVFSQELPFCTPPQLEQYNKIRPNKSACLTSCTGLYADVDWADERNHHQINYDKMLSEYNRIKNLFSENLEFDPNNHNGFSKLHNLAHMQNITNQ